MDDEHNFEAFCTAVERRDYETALCLALPHAEAGNSDAQCAMGLLCGYGMGVPRSWELAEQWLVRAAEQHNPVAWNNLGTLYSDVGNVEKARQCYQRAKDLGFNCAHPYPPF